MKREKNVSRGNSRTSFRFLAEASGWRGRPFARVGNPNKVEGKYDEFHFLLSEFVVPRKHPNGDM